MLNNLSKSPTLALPDDNEKLLDENDLNLLDESTGSVSQETAEPTVATVDFDLSQYDLSSFDLPPDQFELPIENLIENEPHDHVLHDTPDDVIEILSIYPSTTDSNANKSNKAKKPPQQKRKRQDQTEKNKKNKIAPSSPISVPATNDDPKPSESVKKTRVGVKQRKKIINQLITELDQFKSLVVLQKTEEVIAMWESNKDLQKLILGERVDLSSTYTYRLLNDQYWENIDLFNQYLPPSLLTAFSLPKPKDPNNVMNKNTIPLPPAVHISKKEREKKINQLKIQLEKFKSLVVLQKTEEVVAMWENNKDLQKLLLGESISFSKSSSKNAVYQLTEDQYWTDIDLLNKCLPQSLLTAFTLPKPKTSRLYDSSFILNKILNKNDDSLLPQNPLPEMNSFAVNNTKAVESDPIGSRPFTTATTTTTTTTTALTRESPVSQNVVPSSASTITFRDELEKFILFAMDENMIGCRKLLSDYPSLKHHIFGTKNDGPETSKKSFSFLLKLFTIALFSHDDELISGLWSNHPELQAYLRGDSSEVVASINPKNKEKISPEKQMQLFMQIYYFKKTHIWNDLTYNNLNIKFNHVDFGQFEKMMKEKLTTLLNKFNQYIFKKHYDEAVKLLKSFPELCKYLRGGALKLTPQASSYFFLPEEMLIQNFKFLSRTRIDILLTVWLKNDKLQNKIQFLSPDNLKALLDGIVANIDYSPLNKKFMKEFFQALKPAQYDVLQEIVKTYSSSTMPSIVKWIQYIVDNLKKVEINPMFNKADYHFISDVSHLNALSCDNQISNPIIGQQNSQISEKNNITQENFPDLISEKLDELDQFELSMDTQYLNQDEAQSNRASNTSNISPNVSLYTSGSSLPLFSSNNSKTSPVPVESLDQDDWLDDLLRTNFDF